MNKITKKWFVFFSVFLSFTGCTNIEKSNELIVVDINQDYPKKEILLQDFMDVEYIVLETSDDFITQGVILDIGEKYILAKNWYADGDIFIFDRKTGKGIRKFNKKGQGYGEYNYINQAILDEEKNEIFINSTQLKKIFVYDLVGNFKRSFSHANESEFLEIHTYDENHLICYDMSGYYRNGQKRDKKSYHWIISKENGHITKDFHLPFETIQIPMIQEGDFIASASIASIIPNQKNWIIADSSTDTIYHYSVKTDEITPFIVRTPSKKPVIFLTVAAITNEYYFMKSIKNTFDFAKRRGFPSTCLAYDRNEKVIYEIDVLNGDFIKSFQVDLYSNPVNNQLITAYQTLQSPQLVEAYKKGELTGKLKELVSSLNEESNPVIMVMKDK